MLTRPNQTLQRIPTESGSSTPAGLDRYRDCDPRAPRAIVAELGSLGIVAHMTNNTSSVDPRIIGSWKGIGGDYGLVNEYRSDCTVVQHVGDRASRPLPFRTEGNYVIYSLEQPNGSIFEQKTQ